MLKLIVPAMSCGHCMATVRNAVAGVDPAATVDIDLARRVVDIDTVSDRAAIVAAIDAAGYLAEPAA